MKSINILFSLLLVLAMPTIAFSQTGTIEGTVINQNTGTPLADADIFMLETDMHQTTDAAGRFAFTGIAPGTYTVSVSHPSFDTPQQSTFVVKAAETTRVEIRLDEIVALEKIIVEGERLPPTVSRKDIRKSELIRLPGTGRDALKGITTLPSIGIPNDIFGILYIRGAAPGDTLHYFDRVPFGYPFHYGGLVSTINVDIIDEIQIYAGGYGAEFGMDSQAVLDIRSRERATKKWGGVVDMNLLYPKAFVERQIGDNGYAYAAARRSIPDLIFGLFFNFTIPYVSDYQFKFAYDFANRHHLTLNALSANDHFDFSNADLGQDEEVSPFNAYFKNGFEGGGIHLRSEVTPELTSHLSLTRSLNFLNINFGAEASDADEEFRYNVVVNAPSYTLREDVTYHLTSKFRLEPGFLIAFGSPKSFEVSTVPILPAELGDNGDDGDNVEIEWQHTRDDFNIQVRRTEGYLQARYEPVPFLSAAAGVRLDYLNLTEELSVQPRGAFVFTLPNSSRLRLVYGRYEQSPQPYQLFTERGNLNLKSSIAHHYIAELEHDLSPQTEFKLAGYYKTSENLVTRDEAEGYLNQGDGTISGTEVFVRHRVNEKFFGWFSYAWTHAERRAYPHAEYQPHLFDNTHIVSIVGNYSLTPRVEVGAKWQFSSGTSSVPLSELILIQDPGTRGMHPLLSGEVGSAFRTRLPTYHRLDLRLNAKRELWGLPLTGFVEVLNVYNRRNVMKFVFSDELLEVVSQNEESNAEELNELTEIPQFPFIVSTGIIFEF